MKKLIPIIALLVLVIFIFSSCDSFSTATDTNELTTTEKQISPSQKAANELPDYLKQILKNPESLQIHEIICYKGDDLRDIFNDANSKISTPYIIGSDFDNCDFLFSVDLSAQNGFGGMNRETYLLYYKNSSGFRYIDKDSDSQKYLIIKNIVNLAEMNSLGENLSVTY